MKGLFAQNGSPISLMLLHVVDRVGRPINQVSLSFIKPETSEGDFMLFPQIFWENTQFYLRLFFLTFETQHVILYLILLTQHIKFPTSLMFPSPQQNRTEVSSNNKSYCEFTFSNDFPTHGPFHFLSRVGRLLLSSFFKYENTKPSNRRVSTY